MEPEHFAVMEEQELFVLGQMGVEVLFQSDLVVAVMRLLSVDKLVMPDGSVLVRMEMAEVHLEKMKMVKERSDQAVKE